jgi:hypothetical protein
LEISQALAILDAYLPDRHLSNIQEIIFVESWHGHTYVKIADGHSYDPVYIRQLGLELWRLLSQALGEKVTKSNFKTVLGRVHRQAQINSDAVNGQSSESASADDSLFAQSLRDRSDETVPCSAQSIDLQDAPQLPFFVGRKKELDILQRWIVTDRCKLILFPGHRRHW